VSITMFDSAFNSQFPPNPQAVAGYVDGRVGDQPNYDWIVANFPKAHHLSISVFGNDADCLDIESGAASVASASAWYSHRKAAGVARPVFYASVSLMESALIPAITAAGIPRSGFRLWSAHYGNGEHICGPATCGLLSFPADGTQWTDHAGALTCDQSLLNDDFFGGSAVTVTYSPVTVSLPVLALSPAGQPLMSDTALPHFYIRRLQLILNGIYGFYKGAIDGIYGPATAAAVKAVQHQLSLVQDGICGPKTWARVIGG
jgi:hypothetical protein